MTPEVLNALETVLNMRVVSHRPVTGGMINQVYYVETDQRALVVKTADGATADAFRAEADGLNRLRSVNALRVPEVLAVGDDACRFLALEWLEPAPVQDAAQFTARFAERLAYQHRTAVSPEGWFGLERDNYIGSLPQDNTPSAAWGPFYRERRLLPQTALARRQQRLTAEQERLLLMVCDRLSILLEGMEEPATLLHGDLWSGNFLCLAGDEPAVIDPSVYYGPREMELAFIELFGGFPPGFMTAYQNAYPLSEGYERRRPLHQLYPLLVHANLFGAPYPARVETICRALLATAV